MHTAPPDVNSHDTLEAELLNLAGRVAIARCRWLELLAKFNISEQWRALGFRSCAHWLRARMGLSRRAADEQLRIARALADLPLITERFNAGSISYSKVRAITRVATAGDESKWLALAASHTAGQLEAAARRRSGDGEREPSAAATPELHWRWDGQGNLRIQGTFTPEQGAMLLAALETAAAGANANQSLPNTDNPGPSAGARRATALLTLLQRARQSSRPRRQHSNRGPGARPRPGPPLPLESMARRRDRRPRPAADDGRIRPRRPGPEHAAPRPTVTEPTAAYVPEPRSAPLTPTPDGDESGAIS